MAALYSILKWVLEYSGGFSTFVFVLLFVVVCFLLLFVIVRQG